METWIGVLVICVQAVFALALIRFGTYFRAVLKELRKERLAFDRVTHSNQNVVYWLSQQVRTPPHEES